MKSFLFALLFLVLSSTSYSQLISNKYSIYFNYSFGNFLGSKTIIEDNYLIPSLYSNYKNLSGFSIKGLLGYKDYFGYGLNYELQSANEWATPYYPYFENSEIQLHSLTPIFRFHNKFKDKGFSNRLITYCEIGPTLGLSSLYLSQKLFDIRTDDNTELSHPMKDDNIYLGIKGTIGLEYAFLQSIGCFFSYSYDLNWVSSKFYDDNSFMSSIINFGMVLKFNKNKYFYY